jgi:hypothetical protein
MAQALCDQLLAFPIVASVQDDQILWIGAPADTGRPRVHSRLLVRTSREAPICATEQSRFAFEVRYSNSGINQGATNVVESDPCRNKKTPITVMGRSSF